jgi:hypothetical protein
MGIAMKGEEKMIKFEETEVSGWRPAIRGMRNPMNSWDKSDSKFGAGYKHGVLIGPNDLDLMVRLRNAGTDHRKFMRMLTVHVDTTAPLYWWKEFDTYKVGTVANSCSTMHKIHSKPIEESDFSFENFEIDDEGIDLRCCFINVVADCELLRQKYLETKDKKYWRGLIQLLPTSYNQKRTITLNYEVLTNMYHAREHHKLDEWHELCRWVETLPYAKELITGAPLNDTEE